MKPRIHLAAWLSLSLAACQLNDPDWPAHEPDPTAYLTTSPVMAEIELPPPGEEEGAEEADTEEPEPVMAPIGDDVVRNFEFSGTPLRTAIHAIAEQSGISLYLAPDLQGSIDASFFGVTQDQALRAILDRNDLRLIRDPQGIYWVQADGATLPASRTFVLQSSIAADVGEQIQQLAGTSSTVLVDPVQNLVHVRGTGADVEAVREYVEAVDRLRRQVLLEVNLFEVSLIEDFELGFDHDFLATADGNFIEVVQALTGTDSGFQVFLDDEDGDLSSTLQAIQRHAGIELISSPKVLVVSNTEATIEVVEEVPYINVTSTQTTGDIGTSVLQQVEFKDVGITLTITPTIQEGGVVQIAVNQELSEVTGVFNGIPVVDTRHLLTQFLIEDRRTVVFGGLMQDRRAEVESGVPLLMHIPILGRLFRGDDDASQKRELVVFLTARIVDPREAAGLAPAFRSSYRNKRGELGRGPVQGREEEE
jgi:type II secretory pathway component GspD/PulD (secretin)